MVSVVDVGRQECRSLGIRPCYYQVLHAHDIVL